MAVYTDDVANLLGTALEQRLNYAPTREFLFHPDRGWRFDLCFEPIKLAIEIDGAWHVTLSRQREDAEKRNAAREAGYTVLSYPAASVLTKSRLPLIVEQIARVACGVCMPEWSAYVLSVER